VQDELEIRPPEPLPKLGQGAEGVVVLNHLIAFSLRNRLLVLLAAAALLVWGGYEALRLPIDVFPDLNRPTVTILTESPGLAPEEVELLVTRPIEYLLNGATGVQRVRSSSAPGLSIVWVEFEWGSDILKDRQVVAEKVQLARDKLPADARPELAPISSIMGEIMLVALRPANESTDAKAKTRQAMDLRSRAEFDLRNRLLAVEGVAQVAVMGGVLKQYQVVTTPERLLAQDITLEQLSAAAGRANAVAGGGVMQRPQIESLIRINGRSLSPADVARTPIVWRDTRPVVIGDVADVVFAGPVPRGDGSVRLKEEDGITGGSAVILTVLKQPHANTLTLDRELDRALNEFEQELPAGVKLERHIFRQADFIRSAVGNVEEAIRDGVLWVLIILFLFLWNLRTSFITLTAIPLSVLVTALVFRAFGVSINTMTLGGIAVAVGELVDDAIVDIENIFRRLKENRQLPNPAPAMQVIFAASSEVRSSIVYATLIVGLVVLPLFALSGLEGRLFAPLGLAYIVSLAASLLVSLTVTPVLASLLLSRARFLSQPRDPVLLRGLKWIDAKVVRFALRRPRWILGTAAVLSLLAITAISGMGGEFLPPFNEGSLTVNVQSRPGTNLATSQRAGRRVEELLLEVPEVRAVTRRTGRAEMDEHAEGVHSSELDVRLQENERPRPGLENAFLRMVPGLRGWGVEPVGRPRQQVLADIRERLGQLPGVKVNVGQPISHRLDHVMSGTRAQVVVKVFGPDLRVLRETAHDLQEQMHSIPGVVDLQIEAAMEAEVSQVRLEVDRDAARDYGLAPGDVAQLLETAYKGHVVSEVLDGERRFDLVVWYDEDSRRTPEVIGATRLDTPSGRKIALEQVARVLDTTGPGALNRENVQRRIVVSCNVEGRDLASVVGDIRRKVAPVQTELRQRGGGYRLEFAGQFEARQEANLRLLLLGSLALIGVFLLLCKALESWRMALQVLANVPLAAIGSVIALLLVNRPDAAALSAAPWWRWPAIWLSATHLSVAHWVGFIALVGIVSRNGIMMISHYLHLMRHEGEKFGEAMIVRGSLERLAPVLMTAGVAVIGLVPLALGAGQTGKEILYPLAVVVIGGLVVSTLLDQVVTPALFFLFGRAETSDPVTTGGPLLDGTSLRSVDS
jgi:CzcA family heavy metal efflux pump